MNKSSNKFELTGKYIRRTFPNNFYYSNELFPLRKYKFNDFELIGPNNPYPYLKRELGNNWMQANKNSRQYYKAS